jgi:uncharacterized protein YbjT (DUF2867 family)
MARILVTGGTGMLGRALVPRVAALPGATVRVMSRGARPEALAAGIEWAQAELGSGAGLEPAVADVDTIIHAASSPRGDTRQVDVHGTRLLLDAARAAGVRHLIYVSIVGVDRIPYPYYTHKLAVEELIRAGEVPWSIVRITQFHEFVEALLRGMTRLPLVALLPTDTVGQPIDVREAADALCAQALAGPGGLAEVGGPEVRTVGDLARTWLAARGMRRAVVRLPLPGRVARGFRRGEHTCPGRRVGTVTWEQWLRTI